MRSTATSAVLLIAAAAILLAAPAATARSLTSAGSADRIRRRGELAVTVKVQGATCDDVQKKVETSIRPWIKRMVVSVQPGVQVTDDSTECMEDGVGAVVEVHLEVTVAPGQNTDIETVIANTKAAIGPTTDLTQLAEQVKELKSLMNWCKAKKLGVIEVSVSGTP